MMFFEFLLFFLCSANAKCLNCEYIIIIDAGASTTKRHIFEFLKNGTLVSEDFKVIRTPIQNNQTFILNELLKLPQYAKKYMKLQLYATAGLREDPKGQKVLRDIQKRFKEIPRAEATIMNGIDEAKYSWIALKNLVNDTKGMIEMGGGSAQIAFEVKSPGKKTYKINGKQVYLDTYPGFGKEKALLYLNSSCVEINNVCKSAIKKFVDKINLKTQQEFFGLSAFYWVLKNETQVNEIKPNEHDEIEDKVGKLYMKYFLKKHGIRTIYPIREINGFMVSWTYGAAMDLLNTKRPTIRCVAGVVQ